MSTGFWNSGDFNTGTGNSGETNTGFGNSGNVNTNIGATTNSGQVNPGFGNMGSGMSGFFNTTGGGITNGLTSGFFNSANGGTGLNGDTSGIGSVGIPGNILGPVRSGANSGLFNVGTAVSGLPQSAVVVVIPPLGGYGHFWRKRPFSTESPYAAKRGDLLRQGSRQVGRERTVAHIDGPTDSTPTSNSAGRVGGGLSG